MSSNQPASEEIVIREHPRSTYLLEGRMVRAAGNLVLTNERLIYLRQVLLNEQQTRELQGLTQRGATASELLQFALHLHKKNFQVLLSSVVEAKTGFLTMFPLRPYLRVRYRGTSKNIKTLGFFFTLPLLKRLLMVEFPTIGWSRAVNKAVKAKRRAMAVQL